MLIYKQRYKPRTTREFTKSDLTVYDSAGNTALNALTVYGKSEVVDGAITSAGEGYAVVRLADLTWNYNTNYAIFYANVTNIKNDAVAQKICNTLLCDNETIFTWVTPAIDRTIYSSVESQRIYIKDADYTTVSDFVASLGNATLVYEEATPTNNAIAVKTDNGTGVNGTMATFATGTPLRGIPDSNVRDVMAWDGSTGTVEKNCGEVDLGTLDWSSNPSETPAFITPLSTINCKPQNANMLCPLYTPEIAFWNIPNNDMKIASGIRNLNVSNLQYENPTDFKTAMSGVKLIYELDTPSIQQLTTAENANIAGLRAFEPQTHAQNNAQAEMTLDYTIRVPNI